MELRGVRVSVVGAGIGGACAAVLLARAGAEVTLVERVAEPRAIGAGILLQPNGLAVLYGLGLRDAIMQGSFVTREGAIYDAAGRPLVRLQTFDFGDGLDHFVAIRRSTLSELLIDRVERDTGIDTSFGVEVHEIPESDLVIGADGVHSVVRSACGIPHRLHRTGVSYVRGLVDGDVVDGFGEYWTRLGLFGIGPVGDATYFFAGTACPAVAEAVAARDLSTFRAAWIDALPGSEPVLSCIGSFDDLLVNEVETVHCRRFVHTNVALLGDAAHAMYPNVGQGANSALVDAAVLVSKLRDAPDVGTALRRYDRVRRPRTKRVQRDAARLARLAALRPAPLRAMRDMFLRSMTGRGVSRRRLFRTMQVDPAVLLHEVRSLSAG